LKFNAIEKFDLCKHLTFLGLLVDFFHELKLKLNDKNGCS